MYTQTHLDAHILPQGSAPIQLLIPLSVRGASVTATCFCSYSIHHWSLGDAGWQEAEVAPALPSLQPCVKTSPAPSVFPPSFLSPPSFCFPPAHGSCQRRAEVEQALFSLSGQLVVLASKERGGPVDGKANNGRNGVHVNIIKRLQFLSKPNKATQVFDARPAYNV